MSTSSEIHLNLINEFTDIVSMSWIQPGVIWPEDWIREFMGRTRTGWFIPREFDEMKNSLEIFKQQHTEFSVHIDILFSSLDALQKKQAKNRLEVFSRFLKHAAW